jgi:hypothetical protein
MSSAGPQSLIAALQYNEQATEALFHVLHRQPLQQLHQ